MIEQTFYKGFEIRRHTFPYNGERRLLGYSVRKTLPDGTVVPYRRKSKNRTATFSDTNFGTEQDARQAIDAGEVVENRPKVGKCERLNLRTKTKQIGKKLVRNK